MSFALGCDTRIAASDAVVGLPEVTLGIIPGAGGTQRLPRLTGLSAAIGLIASGRRVPAAEAARLGLVDAVVEGGLRAAALRHARECIGRKRRISELPVPTEPEEAVERAVAEAMQAARGRTAVKEAIASVRNATRMPFAAAAAEERDTFQRLRQSEEAAALRYLFFAEREAARVPGISGATPRPVARVGIVGAGTMGAAISVCFLDSSIPVALIERDQAALDRGVERIRSVYQRLVQSGRMSAEEMQRRLGMLTPTVALPALAQVDLVIEAVFEDMNVKQALMARARPPVETRRRSRLQHFLSRSRCARLRHRPPRRLRWVALLRTGKRDAADRDRARARDGARRPCHGARIGQNHSELRPGQGGRGLHRQSHLFSLSHAIRCMLEDGAYPEQVDAALVAFGLAMGPFAVNDLSGLDISWRTRQRLAAARDPKARYPEILDRLCEAGRFGNAGAGIIATPRARAAARPIRRYMP